MIEGNLGKVRPPSATANPEPAEVSRSVAIPVMGRIAAGTPISAIQSRSHTVDMSPDFLSHGEHYALEVRGDSMMRPAFLTVISSSSANRKPPIPGILSLR